MSPEWDGADLLTRSRVRRVPIGHTEPMPRSIWKGAISFGLVTIPVKLYSATEEKDISFRQVHAEDGGRIKYKRVCELDGEEVPYGDIAKGYELADGRMVVLDKEDMDQLPLATTKSVEVVQFVDADEVDPAYFNKSYFLQADGPGVKPYVLLRDALTKSEQCAVVKVALRSREALALIRPKDGVLVMHTMLWPDELRDGSFAAPPDTVTVSDAEVTMAQSFIDALSGDFAPDDFTDSYREAVEALVQSKAEGVPVPEEAEAPKEAEVVDLVAALRASVDAAKKRREAAAQAKTG
jgi:DNA end-binding protein Ku